MTNSWSVFRNAEFSLRNPAAKQLFNTFVLAYHTKSSIQLFLSQTRISATDVDLEGPTRAVWLRVLEHAAGAGGLRDLVETALADPSVAGFHPRFRQRLDDDARLPADPPGDDDQVASGTAGRGSIVRPVGGFAYDVAISFVDEDRQYADRLATWITERGYRVFSDHYTSPLPEGDDLHRHLTAVYAESRYCVILASHAYLTRLWAQTEQQAAQEQALRDGDHHRYVIAVRIDAELPGVLSRDGYLDGPDQIGELLFGKLGPGTPISTVDRDRTAVAGTPPPGQVPPRALSSTARPTAARRRWDAEFRLAAATFDRVGLARLSAEYAAELYSVPKLPATVGAVLQTLRQTLCHEEVELVADAAFAHDIDSPVVRRQYAQVLVDGGNPAVALRLYLELARDKTVSEHDRAEADGGIGRCYKELFLACREPTRRRRYLQCSLDAYLGRYRVDPEKLTYHGINAVALLVLAQREGIQIDGRGARSADLAEDILAVLGADPMPDLWSEATACEAAIALRRHPEALDHARAFVAANPQGFTVASVLRQMRAVWQLDTTTAPGNDILPLLRSALLRYQGGRVTVAAHDVRTHRLAALGAPGMARVVGADRLPTLRWYRQGMLRCRAVAALRVGDDDGTGVLVAGWELHPSLPRVVLLTTAANLPDAVQPADIGVVFPALGADLARSGSVDVGRVHRFDHPPDADAEIVVLELSTTPTGIEPVPLAPTLPAVDQERVYVVEQLPDDPEPQFRLQDGALLGRDEAVLHYRAATVPTAPGTPVFDQNWELVGLHRRHSTDLPRIDDGGTYDGSEGIAVHSLITQLAASIR